MKRRTFFAAMGAVLAAACGVKAGQKVTMPPLADTYMHGFYRVRILPSVFFADVVAFNGSNWQKTGERLRIEWPSELEGTYVPDAGLCGIVRNIDGHWTVMHVEHRTKWITSTLPIELYPCKNGATA